MSKAQDVRERPYTGGLDPELLEAMDDVGTVDAIDSDDRTTARRRDSGSDQIADAEISSAIFQDWRTPRPGRANPERIDSPFWRHQIRTRAPAHAARAFFAVGYDLHDPIWCFSRFGHSFTKTPDGRAIEIGGEHEDSYDPDFHIYNDVVVHDGRGGVEVFGYPFEVFEPTDFHSATLVGDAIYVIGSLGYAKHRRPGETPVLRLDLSDYSFARVETTGEAPGWISRHRAALVDGAILVRGGQVWTADGALKRTTAAYRLDLRTNVWSRA